MLLLVPEIQAWSSTSCKGRWLANTGWSCLLVKVALGGVHPGHSVSLSWPQRIPYYPLLLPLVITYVLSITVLNISISSTAISSCLSLDTELKLSEGVFSPQTIPKRRSEDLLQSEVCEIHLWIWTLQHGLQICPLVTFQVARWVDILQKMGLQWNFN